MVTKSSSTSIMEMMPQLLFMEYWRCTKVCSLLQVVEGEANGDASVMGCSSTLECYNAYLHSKC